MKRKTNPLIALTVVFVALVLGLGVTIGIVIGVGVANHGVTIDAITSGAGAMIGAMLTVGAALGVFLLQERRAEQHRRDEMRLHALQLLELTKKMDQAVNVVGASLGWQEQKRIVKTTFMQRELLRTCIATMKQCRKEMPMIPIPGALAASNEIRAVFGPISTFGLMELPGEKDDSKGDRNLNVEKKVGPALKELLKRIDVLRNLCENYI